MTLNDIPTFQFFWFSWAHETPRYSVVRSASHTFLGLLQNRPKFNSSYLHLHPSISGVLARQPQRASTFVLNVLLQRAMLSADSPTPSSSDASTPDNSSSSGSTSSSALEAYGAAAITLELISSTALFLAREPFRVALARSRVPSAAAAAGAAAAAADSDGEAGRGDREQAGRRRREAYRRRFVNTAWVAAPAGVAFAALVWLAYPWVIQNDAFGGVEENRQVGVCVVCV